MPGTALLVTASSRWWRGSCCGQHRRYLSFTLSASDRWVATDEYNCYKIEIWLSIWLKRTLMLVTFKDDMLSVPSWRLPDLLMKNVTLIYICISVSAGHTPEQFFQALYHSQVPSHWVRHLRPCCQKTQPQPQSHPPQQWRWRRWWWRGRGRGQLWVEWGFGECLVTLEATQAPRDTKQRRQRVWPVCRLLSSRQGHAGRPLYRYNNMYYKYIQKAVYELVHFTKFQP